MINGKNFMFYVECETLTGSVMLPLCEAKSVQLQYQTEMGNARKEKDTKWQSFYYKSNTYSLSLDGLITYSDEDINELIISIQNKLLMIGDKLVSIGGEPFNPGGGYFCLENALFDWKTIKWAFESIDTPMKWRGEVLVNQLSASFNADGNSLAEFSTSLQGNGKPERFHTPIPTELKLEGTSDTLPTEDATFTENGSDPQTGAWTQRFIAAGNYLPTGKFHVDIYGDQIDHIVNPGETLEEIVSGLASQINAKQYTPPNPPPGVITAKGNDDTLEILLDAQHSATASYIAHTGTLKTAYLSFSSKVNYDFYRVKVMQGSNEWYIDVGSTKPGIILPTGTYTLSVSGMGQDLQYSDYSDTINVTI